MTPQPPPASGATVQLIPAAGPVPHDVYPPPPPSQHAAYFHPDVAVHGPTAAPDTEPIVQLNVDPKSGLPMYGAVEPGYQVIPPSDGSLSYASQSCDVPLPHPTQMPHPAVSSMAGPVSRPYEEGPEFYSPQSTLLVTSLHPGGGGGSRPLLTGSLRQPVSVIISSELAGV